MTGQGIWHDGKVHQGCKNIVAYVLSWYPTINVPEQIEKLNKTEMAKTFATTNYLRTELFILLLIILARFQ